MFKGESIEGERIKVESVKSESVEVEACARMYQSHLNSTLLSYPKKLSNELFFSVLQLTESSIAISGSRNAFWNWVSRSM